MNYLIIHFFVTFAICFTFMTHPFFSRIRTFLERKYPFLINNPVTMGILFAPISLSLIYGVVSLLYIKAYAIVLASGTVVAILAELDDRLRRNRK